MVRTSYNLKYYKERRKYLKGLENFNSEMSLLVDVNELRPYFNAREFRMFKTIEDKVCNFLFLCTEKVSLRQHTDKIMKEKYPIFNLSETERQMNRKERTNEVFDPIFDLILSYVYSSGETREKKDEYLYKVREILDKNLRH